MTPTCIAQEGALWVLDKPSGMAVHPAGGTEGPDLLAWAREHLAAPADLAPIHRLDKETSGLVLLASDPAVRASLGGWFAEGLVRKEYLALVLGRPPGEGVVRKALSDGRRGRPLAAVTHYRSLQTFRSATLLEVRPESGRKHQIRRHLHAIGHPVVGDTRYRPRRFRPVPGFPGRLWLHAHRLTLPDGRCWEAPLPEVLATHLEVLAEAERPGGRGEEAPREPAARD